jgi:hypothetical protein
MVYFYNESAWFLTLQNAVSPMTNVVDLYNIAMGTWSTAELSVARASIASTSVGRVAIFAGGFVLDGWCGVAS